MKRRMGVTVCERERQHHHQEADEWRPHHRTEHVTPKDLEALHSLIAQARLGREVHERRFVANRGDLKIAVFLLHPSALRVVPDGVAGLDKRCADGWDALPKSNARGRTGYCLVQPVGDLRCTFAADTASRKH
jgi:hypothetical protein